MKTTKGFIWAAAFAALAFTSAAVFAQQEQDSNSMLQQQLQQYQSQQPQSQQPKQPSQLELVSELIKDDLIGNKELIRRESSQLSDADKWYLYRMHRTKAPGWAALNFFPGFGTGSYLQGDLDFGILQSVLDLNGSLIIIFGLQTFGGEYGKEELIASVAAGMAIIVCSRIMGVVYPHIYKYKRNKHLMEALNYDHYEYKNVSYSIDPLIVPKKNSGAPALGLGFNVRY
jgi:hypothetical protein